jgi:uncharacterized membrane protein
MELKKEDPNALKNSSQPEVKKPSKTTGLPEKVISETKISKRNSKKDQFVDDDTSTSKLEVETRKSNRKRTKVSSYEVNYEDHTPSLDPKTFRTPAQRITEVKKKTGYYGDDDLSEISEVICKRVAEEIKFSEGKYSARVFQNENLLYNFFEEDLCSQDKCLFLCIIETEEAKKSEIGHWVAVMIWKESTEVKIFMKDSVQDEKNYEYIKTKFEERLDYFLKLKFYEDLKSNGEQGDKHSCGPMAMKNLEIMFRHSIDLISGKISLKDLKFCGDEQVIEERINHAKILESVLLKPLDTVENSLHKKIKK